MLAAPALGGTDSLSRATAAMLAGRGETLPVSALPVDGTFPDRNRPLREALDRRGDPDLGSLDLHRLRQVRDRLPARRDPDEGVPGRGARRRARGLPVEGLARPAPARHEDDDPGRPRRLHGLRDLRRHLPRAREGSGRAPLDQPRAEARPPRGRARAVRLLPLHPRDRPDARRAGDGEGLADARAAVRVLGRLRGLRRDAVPQAADPALRRPDARRERDRLLVDLRRQPADDAVELRTATGAARPGRTRSSRTTPSSASACDSRSTRRSARRARSSAELAPDLAGSLAAADPHTEAGRRRAAPARGGAARAALDGSSAPRRAGSRRSQERSSARASGSSAATAGPTTSASAASTTSSPRAATSTCSCSTPRSTRTPAARRRRRRRAGRSRSSPPAASRPARRISACSRPPTATSTSPTSRSAPTTRRPSRRSPRPTRGTGRRS